MESTNERTMPSPSSSPLSSSSDYLQAAPESTAALRKHDEDKGIGNSDPRLNQTLTAGESAYTGTDLSPKTLASTSGPLEVDAGNGLGTLENGYGRDLRSHQGHTTAQSPTGSTDEDFVLGSTPRTEQPSGHSGELSLGNDSATQLPPTQVMERPGDPSSSSYRIPDYVFARKPSTAPMEWSTASNESLFSIQMGNMSFTREQFAWLGKSGELGMPGELNMSGMSGPFIDFSSNQPPDKQVEICQNGGNLDEGPSPRVTEAKAVETMREVIRECAENDNKASQSSQGELTHIKGSPSSSADNHSKGSPLPHVQNHKVSPSLADNKFYNSSCLSHASDGSTKSFAFPM